MKDTEFIELLNLYLDHEISAEDTARLEAEVLSNPQRRRTYQEYCRMQKACVVLARDAVSDLELADRKVVAFEVLPSRSWGFGTFATGLCAAAACIALVLVVRNRFETKPAMHVEQSISAQVAVIQEPSVTNHDLSERRAISGTVSVVPRKQGELKPVFAAYTSLSESNNRSNPFATVRDTRFEWLNNVQISSLAQGPGEDLVFRAKSGEVLETRALFDDRAVNEKIERAAFQFQR